MGGGGGEVVGWAGTKTAPAWDLGFAGQLKKKTGAFPCRRRLIHCGPGDGKSAKRFKRDRQGRETVGLGRRVPWGNTGQGGRLTGEGDGALLRGLPIFAWDGQGPAGHWHKTTFGRGGGEGPLCPVAISVFCVWEFLGPS